MQEQLPRHTRLYVEHSDRANVAQDVPFGRRTTAGQGLFLQSFCIPSVHGGQMQEVEQCRSNCRVEGWCNIRASHS